MALSGELGHLARRLVSSLSPAPPPPTEEEWARSRLSDAEGHLWAAQPARDRRHAVAVARYVISASPRPLPPWVVAAALLHDVGKADAGLGIAGRVLATGLELVGVRAAPGRLGRYLRYGERGAAMLAGVGADRRVVAWAREHHQPPSDWSVPRWAGRLLAAADRA